MCARNKIHAFNFMDPPEWSGSEQIRLGLVTSANIYTIYTVQFCVDTSIGLARTAFVYANYRVQLCRHAYRSENSSLFLFI
jgi:hypothetical protein